jgi:hypothetical protein
MQRAVIVSGTLGLGTALVFGAAAVASALFPNGSTVPMGWNGGGVIFDKGIAVPMPMPAEPGVIIDDGKGGTIDDGKGDTQAVPEP